MLKQLGAVSLLALSLFTGLAQAQDQPADGTQLEVGAAVDVPADILALINDQRPLSEMTPEELRDRARAARAFAKQQGLTDDIRAQLQEIAKSARAELDARGTQPKKAAEPAPAEQPVEKPVEQAAPEPVPEVAPVQEAAPEPAPELAPVLEAAPEPAPAPATEQPVVEQPAVEPPAQQAVEPAPAAPAAAVDKQEVQELDANAGVPEAEKKAMAFLSDATPADQLSDDDLKARLDAMRDLMAANELSQKTERALRKKLQIDRRVLRQRIAVKEAADEQAKAKAEAEASAAAAAKQAQEQGTTPKADKKPRIVIVPQITINTPVIEILRDRRRSEELSDDELRRRVNVFRDSETDDEYADDFDEEDREFWRESIRRDRELLRRRMAEERRDRAEELALNEEDDDIEIEDDFDPGREAPRNVFEAEADDEELEDVLVSAPTRKVRQRYTIEEIGDRAELRDSMPRIEIDTIRFGFNEAFVREEEVENLDRVAAIIERILRKRPREQFIIEGHTDAVGSDAYNLKLSRARAEAIKKALTTYYVISPRNLKTVGLGERYLKIPTAEAEAENRRASVSRGTPLLGELEE